MPDRYTPGGISSDPKAIADISRRREGGEALASIAKDYNVSRERIRQLCNKWNVPSPVVPSTRLLEQAMEMLNNGQALSIDAAAELLKCCSHTLKRAAKTAGVDLAAASANARDEASKRLHDGKTFGMWTVIAGTHRRVERPGVKYPTAVVDCRCDCGTERTVSTGNLLGGISRGCGCRCKADGLTHRVVVPWRCLETDQRVPSTRALANQFQINPLKVTRRLNRQENFLAPDGTTWIPLRQEAVVHQPAYKPRAWTCLDTGETWPSAKALAKHLGIQGNQLSNCARQGRTYCAADRLHYTPLGKEDLRRSAFVPRIGARQQRAA